MKCPICTSKLDEAGDCPTCISDITNDDFHTELEGIVAGMMAASILAVPGVYEILAEEFNNEVLSNVYQAKLERGGHR